MSARRLQLANSSAGWMDHKHSSGNFCKSGCLDDDGGSGYFGVWNG
jgi:hypothetical protein